MAGGGPCVMGIFAHPDDETYRCGGTLALLARRGVRVQVLTATRGQAGSCGDPPLCTPEELPEVRERELRCACAALGLEPPLLLDYLDGRLAEVEEGELVSALADQITRFRPWVVVSFGPDGMSGHPDHVVIGRCARRACERSGKVEAVYALAVPSSQAQRLGMVNLRTVPDEDITLVVDISPAWEAKWEAIRCHATQMSSSPITSAPGARRRAFLGVETFVQLAGRPGVLEDLLSRPGGEA